MRLAARTAGILAVLALAATSLSGCALAAVAAGGFSAQRQAASDATLKSQLANDEISTATYAVNNNGSYSGMTADNLPDVSSTDIPKGFAVTVSDAGTTYCLQGVTTLGTTLHVTGTGSFASGGCPKL